jgi:hypothetical protein
MLLELVLLTPARVVVCSKVDSIPLESKRKSVPRPRSLGAGMGGVTMIRSAGLGMAMMLVLWSMESSAQVWRHDLSLQGGWWNVEADYVAPFGGFVSAGVPWAAWLTDSLTGGTAWNAALEAKVGYQGKVLRDLHLRGGFRMALAVWQGTQCLDSCPETETRFFGFAEVGLRYQHPGGFVVGVDIPVWGIKHSDDSDSRAAVRSMPTWVAVLFSQVYVGYRWRF